MSDSNPGKLGQPSEIRTGIPCFEHPHPSEKHLQCSLPELVKFSQSIALYIDLMSVIVI